jgi:pyruvate dehydrogenase E2 component (dihydrolipoamide acetyltransferase)
MATEVVMPRLSDSMEEGTVVEWLVAEGDVVKRGQPIVEIETDKATMPYEAEEDGVVLRILVGVGQAAALGAAIAVIGAEGEQASEGAADAGSDFVVSAAAPTGAEAPTYAEAAASPDGAPMGATPNGSSGGGAVATLAPPAQPASPGPNGKSRVAASPLARRVASDLGVDLAAVSGTGPGGRVVRADVEAAAGSATAAPSAGPPAPSAAPSVATDAARGEVEVHELTRLQQTVARRMAESRAAVPEFELRADVDMGACVELREQLRAIGADPLPSYNDMIVKASAIALREFPRVNGAYKDGTFEHYARINVGVAVAADDALVVPTVADADRCTLGDIARTTRALAAKVRDGSITPPDLAGGTFTVSNLGMFGIDSFSAVINVPQSAILAVGALKKRPVVDEHDDVVVRPLLTLTLACDHRILYGADGARFLARLRDLLEQPLSFAL